MVASGKTRMPCYPEPPRVRPDRVAQSCEGRRGRQLPLRGGAR